MTIMSLAFAISLLYVYTAHRMYTYPSKIWMRIPRVERKRLWKFLLLTAMITAILLTRSFSNVVPPIVFVLGPIIVLMFKKI